MGELWSSAGSAGSDSASARIASRTPAWLVFVTAVSVAAGMYFRFTNLSTKTFWYDETYTSVQTCGWEWDEVRAQMITQKVMTVAELRAYEEFKPGTSALSVIGVISRRDPQHPPTYYVLTRLWNEVFGTSIASFRALAACFGVLMLPCMYWLCMELFDRNRIIALSAVAMMAVAPIHVLYAQEAREYSMWMVGILLSSAALVRAVRVGRWQAWALYGLTALLGMYTLTLFALVQIVHALYVAAVVWPEVRAKRLHVPRAVWGFALSSLAAVLLFAPWIWQIIENWTSAAKQSSWVKRGGGIHFLIRAWITAAAALVLDWHPGRKATYLALAVAIFVAIVALVGWIRMRRDARWLSIGLVVIPAAALAIPDLMFGGVRSVQARYLMPVYVGVALAVAFAIGGGIASQIRPRRVVALVLLLLVVLGGTASASRSAQSEYWWDKGDSAEVAPIGRLLVEEHQKHALLIVAHLPSLNTGRVLVLSRHLDPTMKVFILPDNREPSIPPGYEDCELFLVLHDGNLKAPLDPALAARLRPVEPYKKLFRLER